MLLRLGALVWGERGGHRDVLRASHIFFCLFVFVFLSPSADSVLAGCAPRLALIILSSLLSSSPCAPTVMGVIGALREFARLVRLFDFPTTTLRALAATARLLHVTLEVGVSVVRCCLVF